MIIKSIYMLVTYEENRPPGRPKRRWEGNTKIDITEVEREGVHWTHLVVDRKREQWNFDFHNMQEMFSLIKEAFASQQLCFVELSYLATQLFKGETQSG